MERAGKPLDEWQADAIQILTSYREDGDWAAYEYCELCPRQNGKGAILEARVLLGFLVFGEMEILWSAQQYRTSLVAWRRMKALFFALGNKVNDFLVEVDGILIKIINSHGEEGFERLDTGARIKFIARSKNTGRGFTGDLIIIDEAYAYESQEQEAQAPTQLATETAQTIYTSSPPLSGDTGEPLYELRDRALSGDEDSLAYRDWGIEGDLEDIHKVDPETGRPLIDVNDPRHIAAANPAFGIRLKYHRVLKVKKAMRASKGEGFGRECLGLWPRRKKHGGHIAPAHWAGLVLPGARRAPGAELALAFDIEPDRSYAAVALYSTTPDGQGYAKITDFRPGTEWLAGRLRELRSALDPLCIVSGKGSYESVKTELDDVGITVPEVPSGGRTARYHRGHIAVLTATDTAAATGRFLDAVKRGTIHHVGQEELDDAVPIAQTRQSGDSLAWSRKPGQEGAICTLVAVTEAKWGYEVRGSLVRQDDYDVMKSIG